ncbi:hypothetical protein K0M31_018568 [Melipona bicolor]|uniref:Uncharacterized protein n=1 Tax=Melipona bicolor TaxID=60889 RepID=A0AA40G3M6_9HYME|nr:hypothetical protein K0M31_018568 [Melipona bicolor]
MARSTTTIWLSWTLSRNSRCLAFQEFQLTSSAATTDPAKSGHLPLNQRHGASKFGPDWFDSR